MPQGGITVRSVHRPGELPVTTADASNPRSLLTTPERLASVAFGLWMVVGLFLDGWAHDNAKPESFFTPWHGVLYSGFAASAAAAVLVAMRARSGVRPWRAALPVGPGLTLPGPGVFAPGAVGAPCGYA